MNREQASAAARNLRDDLFLQDALHRMREDSITKLANINFTADEDVARGLQANIRVIDGIYLAIETALIPEKSGKSGLA